MLARQGRELFNVVAYIRINRGMQDKISWEVFSTTIAFRGLSRAFSNLSSRERKDDSGYLLLTRQPPNASHFAIEKVMVFSSHRKSKKEPLSLSKHMVKTPVQSGKQPVLDKDGFFFCASKRRKCSSHRPGRALSYTGCIRVRSFNVFFVVVVAGRGDSR